MRSLKKDTVKTVIDLANVYRAKLMKKGKTVPGEMEPDLISLLHFLNGLSQEEIAELAALTWLGKEAGRKPTEWDMLVSKGRLLDADKLFEISRELLPQHLRLGMERLAKHAVKSRSQKTKPIEPTGRIDQITPDDRRAVLVGRVVIDQYRKKYGESALWRLYELLELNGVFNNTRDRELFRRDISEINEEFFAVLGGNT